jgi:hypothetical protein
MSTLSRATGTTRERRRNDFYATVDPRAVVPLLRFLSPGQMYLEPCAGDGSLIALLDAHGFHCYGRFDLEPQCPYIPRHNAMALKEPEGTIITNPPWLRSLLHPLILHLVNIADEVWMLFDSDWPHNKGSTAIGEQYCTDIVSVGRLKWFLNSKHDATDDCSWYRFSTDKAAPTRFHWPSGTRDQSPRFL